MKRIALNLGAPGDRRAGDGTPWLAYPRPKPEKETCLDLVLNVQEEFYAGGKFEAAHTSRAQDKGDAPAWVTASGASGLKRCVFPLLGEKDAPTTYRLHLYFSEAASGAEAPRAISLKVQGKTVLEDFSVSGAARSMREFDGIAVTKDLVLEIAPDSGNPSATGLPVLTGIEVERR